ncbi:MAG TPA: M48 family metallopeptidase, partial [Gammaproteobacteria bacterium]
MPKSIISLAIASLILLAGPSEAQFSMSRSEVERQSRLQWLNMKRSMPRPGDPAIQPFVECISYQIIETLDEPYRSMDWEIIVFDDEATNAFAMPGGKIGVFTGIFRVATTPDALATVIGHEIAHLTEDHVVERARKQLGTDIVSGILSSATYGYGSDSIRQGTAIFLGLPFDRRQESEADVVGLEYMAEAGFDPRSSLQLWRNMSQLGNGAPPEWLSTHPSDDRRMADLATSLTPALIAYNESLEA